MVYQVKCKAERRDLEALCDGMTRNVMCLRLKRMVKTSHYSHNDGVPAVSDVDKKIAWKLYYNRLLN